MGTRPYRIGFASKIRRTELPEDEIEISRSEAAASVASWSSDSFLWSQFVQLYEELTGDHTRGMTASEQEQRVIPSLRRAFDDGTLLATRHRPPRQSAAPPAKAPPVAAPVKTTAAKPRQEKSFIDVAVEDEMGKPVPGLKYRFQAPSGLTETGRLGGDARLFQGNLDPGTGRLTLLKDEGPPLAPGEVSTDGPGFVSFRAVNQAGEPLPGLRYELIAADGTVKTGETDETGAAFVGDLPPGECDLSLPDLADELWSLG